MNKRKQIAKIISRTVSIVIMKLDLHPVPYFVVLLFSLMHTISCILDQQSALFALLKWLDPSFLIDSTVLTYILAVPCFLSAITIVLQFYWTSVSNRLEPNVLHHYIIKISSVLCFCFCHLLCLPQVRCATSMSLGGQVDNKIIGITSLALFLVIVYPFSMFLITDLSPKNNRVYSFIAFPNCFTFINLYRPVVALLIATGNSAYTLIPTSFLFVVLLASIVRSPVVSWRYNFVSQFYIATVLWTVLYRLVGLVSQEDPSIAFFFIGVPIFALFFFWILHKRLVSIIEQPKNSVPKLKILYYMMLARQNYEQQLNIFLIKHYRQCCSSCCSCRKVLAELQRQKADRENNKPDTEKDLMMKTNEKSSFGFMVRMKETKTKHFNEIANITKIEVAEFKDEDRLKEKEYWFELMLDLQNDEFDIRKFRQLSLSDKEEQMRTAQNIIFDQVEIMHYQLERQYQSLRYLWFAEDICDSSQSILLSARFMIILTICKGMLGLMPILLLATTIVVYQLQQNSNVWNLISLRELYGKRLENILLLNSHSYQMIFQMRVFAGKNQSVMLQMQNVLTEIYDVNRNLKSVEADTPPSFTEFANSIRNISFCQILDRIAKKPEEKCSNSQRARLGQKTQNEVLIEYIQTGRSLHTAYRSMPYAIETQRAFVSDSRHEILEQLCWHLSLIQTTVLSRFDEKYISSNSEYQVTIISLSIAAFLLTVIIKRLWIKMQMIEIDFQMDQVKTVFWLISENEVKQNSELGQQFKEHLQCFYVIT